MTQKTVFIAGATGYLGRYLVEEYLDRNWHVIALVRPRKRENNNKNDDDDDDTATTDKRNLPEATRIVEAQATQAETIQGIMDDQNIDLVISALGITRQRDGLTYKQVDYQANVNLLQEAIRAGVPHFGYIHVLHGPQLAHLKAVAAKQEFVDELTSQNKDVIQSTIICPSGFFSDMADFYHMAHDGRVWLFGNGNTLRKINPIHGQDLAKATADAIAQGQATINVGGPDILTQTEIAQLAFRAMNKNPTITYLWDGLRQGLVHVLPWITPLHVYGPTQFFLTVMGMDMVGECYPGTHTLEQHFASLANQEQSMRDM